jgi:hypothetical protein
MKAWSESLVATLLLVATVSAQELNVMYRWQPQSR